MKIVLNKCIGAFDLSPIAIKELYSLKGWKVFFYIMSKNTILIKTTVDIAQSLNGVGIYILTKDYGPMVSFCEVKRGYLFDINSGSWFKAGSFFIVSALG